MRVLIAENDLSVRRGVQLFSRDLAISLLRMGHTPVVYAPELGDVDRDLARATVPVIDTLKKCDTPPDVIHGQSPVDTIAAVLRFPGVPAVMFCHGYYMGGPVMPAITRYVGVDSASRDRLIFHWGAPESRVRVLFNFVDTERFAPRAPLPAQPERALVFGGFEPNHDGLSSVREACATRSIPLDHVGNGFDRATEEPETLLRDYDLVFASGRSALEAMAVGAAVIVLPSVTGLGPLVTPDNLDELRPHNFGARAGGDRPAGYALDQIRAYDASRAAHVSMRIRREATARGATEEILTIYRDAIAAYAETPPEPGADASAAAAYLEHVSRMLTWGTRFRAERNALRDERDRARESGSSLEKCLRLLRRIRHRMERE